MKQKRKAVDGEPSEPCALCGKMPRRVMCTEHGVRFWNCLCQNYYMYDYLAWDERQRQQTARAPTPRRNLNV